MLERRRGRDGACGGPYRIDLGGDKNDKKMTLYYTLAFDSHQSIILHTTTNLKRAGGA